MARKPPPPRTKPPTPAQRSGVEAQPLLAKVMLRVAAKHADPAMRAAGARLAKMAKGEQR